MKKSHKSGILGRYTHSIDDKNRIIIPANWRKYLGQDEYPLTMDFIQFSENSYYFLTIHVSSEPVKSIKSHEFSEQPYLFSTLRYAALDKQGRMLLHEDEKKTCGISEKVKLIGFDDKIQIWDYEMFESYIKNMRIRQTK